jgi:hypothetical protein
VHTDFYFTRSEKSEIRNWKFHNTFSGGRQLYLGKSLSVQYRIEGVGLRREAG